MVIEDSGNKNLKFKNPERLLLVVIAFIFWSVGFLDLLGHTSAQPDVFGLYSFPFFVFILLYGSTITIWIALFVSPKLLSRVADGVGYIQSKTWLALTVLTGLGVALWVILEWDRWTRLPGLQLAAFALVLLAAAVLVFSGWGKPQTKQRWRKVVAFPLLALIAVEAIIQLLALFGILPGTHRIGGHYVPYERIYQNEEGFRNGVANRYGWYYPDASLDNETRKIAIFGTSQVQGLQVEPQQQVSAILAEMINQGQNENEIETEVIAVGLPGFGVGQFLYEEFLYELLHTNVYDKLRPDEIIVFFQLGDDFQSAPPAANPVIYQVDESGLADAHPASARFRHDLSHYFLRGYLSFQLVETLRSHYLTPKVLDGLAGVWFNEVQATTEADNAFDISRTRGYVTDHYALTEPSHAGIKSTRLEKIPGGNNFMFERDANEGREEAIAIAAGLIEASHETITASGIPLRIVTIPAFPEAFYAQSQAEQWEPVIGNYDLFLPERAMVEIAQAEAIPVLPLGQYMYEDGLAVDEIKQLYFQNGQGHFTPLGHEYLARAIYSCFYSETGHGLCSE